MVDRGDCLLVWRDGRPMVAIGLCRNCNQHVHPVDDHCSRCLENQLEQRPVSNGLLETFTDVHLPKEGFPTPYTIGFVRITDDDLRLFTYLTDSAGEYEVGMTVHVQSASFGSFEETWAFGMGDYDA